MEWFNHVLGYFAQQPTHLFALLLAIAFSKSTVVISSVLPPASVMLVASVSLSQSILSPGLAWLAVTLGAALGSVLNYHIGQLMGNTPLVTRLTTAHAGRFLRIQHQLHTKGVIVLFTSRFLAILRYLVPLTAGLLRMHPAKVYSVSLVSAGCWAALYVGVMSGISAL